MPIASVGLRIGGAIIDFILFYVLFFVFAAGLIGASIGLSGRDPSDGTGMLLVVVIALGLFFCYFIVCEAVWGGTPAKLMLGMRVVRSDDGAPIGWGQAFVRNLLRLVDNFPLFLIGILTIAMSQKTQRVGDMAASTVVVKI